MFIFAIALIFSLACAKGITPNASPSTESFWFHLVTEPSSLKAWEQKSSAAGYLMSQLVGTLMTYQNHKLTGNLAENCVFKKPLLVECTLRKSIKWSNGKAIAAKHFINAFQALLNPANKAPQADLLFPIKNARGIFSGMLKPDQLKIKAEKNKLLFELENVDSEFIYSLTSPLLAPIPDSQLSNVSDIAKQPALWISSGAYQIEDWELQKKIRLVPNSHYWKKNKRPALEVFTVPEDSVALNLYEKSELSFLRRLPTMFIPKFKDRADFYQVEQFRFDYIGFSAKWRESLPVRRAISRAISFSDLQNLYHAKGKPGCPGIPENLLQENKCIEYDLVEAISEWTNLREKPQKFEIIYSRQGGDDHKRSMEWLQNELKKNLKLNSEVSGIENQIFIERLEKKPGDLFRKGIAPSRPTCLSAIENFSSGHPENYVQYSHPRFDEIVDTLKTIQDLPQKKKLCSEAVNLLLSEYWIIPTGPIYFAVLASPKWKGWQLNELNQLDLSELEPK